MENGFERIRPEPLRQLAHRLAAGVVEMLARGENLNTLGAGAAGKLQQAGMQALVEEQVGGENAQHRASRGRRGPKQAQRRRLHSFSHVFEGLTRRESKPQKATFLTPLR